jgi:hypothetical protein
LIYFLIKLDTPPALIADFAPFEGTPPDIANGFAFNAPLIAGATGPEGIFILEEAGKFGVDFIFLVFSFCKLIS